MFNVINCVARASHGTSASRNVRKKGFVPAVIYTKDGKNINLLVSSVKMNLLVTNPSLFSEVLTLKVFDESKSDSILNLKSEISDKPIAEHTVLLRDLQFHPVKNIPSHVDFKIVKVGEKINVKVPVVFVNRDKCTALKFGGALIILNYNPEILAEVGSIPKKITFDLSGLPNEKVIRLSEGIIEGNDTIKFLKDRDIAKIAGKKVAE